MTSFHPGIAPRTLKNVALEVLRHWPASSKTKKARTTKARIQYIGSIWTVSTLTVKEKGYRKPGGIRYPQQPPSYTQARKMAAALCKLPR